MPVALQSVMASVPHEFSQIHLLPSFHEIQKVVIFTYDAAYVFIVHVQMAMIHVVLDLLICSTKISAPRKLYMTKSKRKSECYNDDIIYGEIMSFTF